MLLQRLFPLLALIALLAAAGCGDGSPYELAGPPSVVPPLRANIAGRYTGTLTFLTEGQRRTLSITVRIHQNGQAFEGEWATLLDGTVTGTVAGVLDSLEVPTTLSARWTLDAPTINGGRCRGSTLSEGTGPPLAFSAASMPLSPCQSLENLRWALSLDWGSL